MRYNYTQFSVYTRPYEQLALLELGIDSGLFISEGDVLKARKSTQRWVPSVEQYLFGAATDLYSIPLSK